MTIRKSAGFTLIEILVVLMIIGVLFAFIGPRLMRMMGQSDVSMTKLKMSKLKEAIIQYKLAMGHVPLAKEGGLRALLEKPNIKGSENWRGPYIESEDDLIDKWGNEFIYSAPPAKNKNFHYFEIISPGEGGEEGNTEIVEGA